MTKEEIWIKRNIDRVHIDPFMGMAWWKVTERRFRTVAGEEIGVFDYYGHKMVSSMGLHRIIWTLVNGALPKGLVVHHKDGDGCNNKIDNLVALSRKEHSLAHSILRRQF